MPGPLGVPRVTSPPGLPDGLCGYIVGMVWLRTLLAALLVCAAQAADWPQFRGPAGTGIADDRPLPAQFLEGENMAWRTAIPPGHSSPVIAGDRIFMTAYEGERLLVMAVERGSGEIEWIREAPRPRQEHFQPTHGPASPSPVTDGENVYVFFGDFGAHKAEWVQEAVNNCVKWKDSKIPVPCMLAGSIWRRSRTPVMSLGDSL